MPQILVNKQNLPQTIVDACKHDTHRTNGEISVTTLIDAPRIRLLKRRHDYEVDVMDNLYMLMGTALHHILERANINDERKRAFIMTAETIMLKARDLQESAPDKAAQLERAANYIFKLIPVFFPEIASRYIYELTLTLNHDGMEISGTFDLYDKVDCILYDYKFCSVYSYIFPESRKKWKEQTNIYAYMLHNKGYEVKGIKIVAFFRDWSEHGMIKNRDYPDAQVKEIPVTLGNPQLSEHWTMTVAKFISKRVDIHRRAEMGDIDDCTGADRWAKADEWAVKQKGGKRAISGGKFDKKEAAEAFVIANRHKYNDPLIIEYRPGDSVKCERFCAVAQFCDQRKRELELRKDRSE